MTARADLERAQATLRTSLERALAGVAFARPVTIADLEALRDALRAALPGALLDVIERVQHVDVIASCAGTLHTAASVRVPIVG